MTVPTLTATWHHWDRLPDPFRIVCTIASGPTHAFRFFGSCIPHPTCWLHKGAPEAFSREITALGMPGLTCVCRVAKCKGHAAQVSVTDQAPDMRLMCRVGKATRPRSNPQTKNQAPSLSLTNRFGLEDEAAVTNANQASRPETSSGSRSGPQLVSCSAISR